MQGWCEGELTRHSLSQLLVLRCDDPLAAHVHNVDDLDRLLPGCVHALREWLRVYKVRVHPPLMSQPGPTALTQLLYTPGARGEAREQLRVGGAGDAAGLRHGRRCSDAPPLGAHPRPRGAPARPPARRGRRTGGAQEPKQAVGRRSGG